MFPNVSNAKELNNNVHSTKESLLNEIRENIVILNKKFTIKITDELRIKLDKDKSMGDLVSDTLSSGEYKTSRDGEYLKYLVDHTKIFWKSKSTANFTVMEFEIKYNSSLKKENKVDKELEKIIKKLALTKDSSYTKVKKIHDYLINMVSYDKEYKNINAYDMLVNKKGTCQSYMLTAYRLLKDAGIKTKIITGTVGTESHGWNIVKVNKKWYNIDFTWNDPISQTGEDILRYDYFLKNNEAFKEHIRDKQFNTKRFNELYPISKTNYRMK